MKRRAITGIMSVLLIFSCLFSPAVQGETEKKELAPDKGSYEEYMSLHSGADYAGVRAESMPMDIEPDSEGRLLVKEEESLTCTVLIETSGFYKIEFDYLAATDQKNKWTLALQIDGAVPFDNAGTLVLNRLWKNESALTHNPSGNDLRPAVVQEFIWQTYEARDSQGLVSEPYAFFLESGEHTLTLTNDGQDIYIKNVTANGVKKETPSYKEYIKQNGNTNAVREITLEAEEPSFFSSRSLIASTDLTSPRTSPQSPGFVKLNTLGGANWKYAGDTVYYDFDAPESGYYRLALRFRQNFYNGIRTHRRFCVNGEVPYTELESVAFPYGVGWQVMTLDNMIFLQEGRNSLSLEVVLGENGAIVSGLSRIIYELNTLYRMIVTVTGQTPDIYRDYNLKTEIPGLTKTLEECVSRLNILAGEIETLYGGGGSELSSLTQIKVQLEDMLKDPASITKGSRLTQFKSNISALGAWLNKIREQPLELDTLVFFPDNSQPPKAEAGFFTRVAYSFRRFVASFVTDYRVMGADDTAGGEALRVWIVTGREQAQLLKAMVDDTFTPEHNIGVQVELVPTSGLVEAILAGQGPDIALDRAESDPVNMAMRNALVDLSGFDGFDEVTNGFSPGSMEAFRYKDGYYALPQTQSFDMLFYRTDIFSELNIKVPDTWEELLLDVLPILETSNMTAGVGVLTEATAFKTILYQSGGSIYNAELTKATLDSQLAYEAFKKAVEFYTHYSLPKSYDFMNRFRTGEMPVSIAPYTMYNNLTIGAPELNGLWRMAEIPGVLREDGTVNRTQIMAQSAMVLTKGAKSPENAWKFMKWWVSKESQSRFGNDIESILGVAGRYTPANREAMRELPWEGRQLSLLEKQRGQSMALPNIPGSYFTQRAIYNAFVSAAIDAKNPREQLIYWNEEINLELERKKQEFR